MQYVHKWMLVVLVALLVVCMPSYAKALTEDPNWTQGKLDNGLIYHIYPTDDKEVSVRLVLNAGSLQENDEQKGYAHFVEHMAFNGSRNFTANQIIKVIEESGAQFGPDINAFTSYQLTVYQLDLVGKEDLGTALTWMRDVADGIVFDPEEVEKEKDVILGEFRMRRPEHKNLHTKVYEQMIKESVLADADPIGTKRSVSEATAEGLQEYYQQWYQPQNAEIVIVGDVKEKELPQLLEQHFAGWISNGKLTAKKQRRFKLDLSSRAISIGDKESPSLSYAIDREANSKLTTHKQQHQLWIDEVSQSLISQRLSEALSDSAIAVQNFGTHTYWINYDRFSVGTISFSPQQRDTVEGLFIATLRSLRDFGVTQGELDSVMAGYQAALNNHDTTWEKHKPPFFAANKVNALDNGQIIQGNKHHHKTLQKFIRSMSLKRVNNNLDDMLSSKLTWLIGFESNQELNANVKRLELLPVMYAKKGVKPVALDKVTSELLQPIQEGKILSRVDRERNLTVWQLSNGIEVWFQQDAKAGKRAYVTYASQGGRAALSPDLYAASNLLIDTAIRSGLGEFNGAKLDRFLRKKDVAVFPFVELTSHGIDVNTSLDSLPLAFNVVYNIASEVKLDERQLDAVKKGAYQDNDVNLNSPQGKYYEAINANTYLPNSRHRFLLNSDIASVTVEQMKAVHKTLFSYDRSNKLVIIADMEPEQIAPLISKYISQISLQADPPAAIHLGNGYDQKAQPRIDIAAAKEDSVLMIKRVINTTPQPRTAKEVFADDMLQKISNIRLDDHIRGKYGFDYAPEIYSVIQDGESVSDWMISTNIASKDIEAVDSELSKFLVSLSSTITQQEVTTAAKQLTVALESLGLDPVDRSWFYTRYLIHGYGIDALLNIEQTAQSITLDYMQQRARLAFGAESRHMTATLTEAP
ncbi:insulinase family protein [Vibrio kasasachensis]|uniref:M16 family metallopeptidase n=1 Tax=Vibrio kasasachensis TaxID=2910248 RepID=UPI003D09EB2F